MSQRSREAYLWDIADSMDVLVIRNNYPELDAADALQFSAIRNSFISYFVGESKTQLVTADEGLAKAAAKENIPIVAVNK